MLSHGCMWERELHKTWLYMMLKKWDKQEVEKQEKWKL